MIRRAALVLAVVLCGAVSSQQALAGQFEVRSCKPGFGSAAFQLSTSDGFRTSALCPPSGVGVRVAAGDDNAVPGAAASWSLIAATGTRIRQVELQRTLGVTGRGWTVGVGTAERVLESCTLPPDHFECTLGVEPDGTPTAFYANLNTSRVSFSVVCENPATTCPGRTPAPAWITVSGVTTLVDDPAPPTIQPPMGDLLAPGWHTGAGRLTASAADASGIKSLTVSAGIVPLGSQAGNCDYSRMQPCPPSMSAGYDVDTSRLGDGTHELRVTATDAADQVATSTATLRVDRTAPAAPAELAVERNPDGTVALLWTNPPQGTAAPITAARYEVCPVIGVGCVAGPVVSGPGVSRIDPIAIPAGDHLVKVWLQDEASNADPANVATLTFDPSRLTSRTVNTNPPVLTAGPAPSPRLRITRARRSGSTLTVSGTIARAASARIEAQVSRSSTGKPVLAKARVKPKRGKWTARVKLPRSLRNGRAMYLAVKYAGQSEYRATTLRRRLTEKPGRVGRATDEFSLEARGKKR